MTDKIEVPKTKGGRPLYNPRRNPFLDLLGIERVVPQEGWDGQCELVIDERHINASGAAHGGAAFSLMDACMAGALRRCSEPDEFASTIECKINYIKAVRIGMVLLCSAKVAQKGSRISVLHAEIRDERNELIAMGMATFTTIKRKP